MNNEIYALAVGATDLERMNLLGNLYIAYNQKFLLANGLTEGMHVADVGCGPGNVSLWLAEKVGQSGTVTAIDNSIEQLTILKSRLAKNNITNTEIQNANIYSLHTLKKQFDLIFCRFLFVHLAEPLQAMTELHKLLKPGGRLIIAELDNQTWSSYPENPYLRKDVELLCKTGELRGVDLTIGSKLYSLFKKSSFNNIKVDLAQPVLVKQEREYRIMKAEAWGKTYIDYKLITQDEFHQLLANIKHVVADENYLLTGAKMFQVCGAR